jgi:hypothetical protein
MTTITINTDCFPKLHDSGFLPAQNIHSIGRAMKDLFFQRFADIVITNTNPHSNVDHTMKHIPKERLVIDFYKWDYMLDVYRYADKYEAYIKEVQAKGINKCVGMDFSLWWDQPTPTLINNLYLNMCRLRQSQDLGFQCIFNWNNAMPEFKCIYEDILPKHVPIVMIDSNHELNAKDMAREIDALKMFTDISQVEIFIVQASRQDIGYFRPFLKEVLDRGIRYYLVPSQTALLGGVRRKQEFEELIGEPVVG